MVQMRSQKTMKRVKWPTIIPAFCITTKKGDLLFSDQEACIYYSYKDALKNKGSHEIRFCEITISLKVTN